MSTCINNSQPSTPRKPCTVVISVKCIDGDAFLSRKCHVVEFPRVNDTIALGVSEYEDYSCNRVTHVNHSQDEVVVFLEAEDYTKYDCDDDAELLADAIDSLLAEGWTLDERLEREFAAKILQQDFDDIPAEPTIWLFDQSDGTEVIVNAGGASASVRSREPGKARTSNALDREIERIEPPIRDRLIKRFLLSLSTKGQLASVLHGEARESVLVAVKLIVCDTSANELWTGIKTLTRVPVIGESVQIANEAYRILNVLHTNPQCGIAARIRCVSIHDYDPKHAKLENLQGSLWED